MKKLLVILFVIAGISQLKAQQLNIKPMDPRWFKAPNASGSSKLKPADSVLLKGLIALPQADPSALLQSLKANTNNSEIFYSRMPVQKLKVNDNMVAAIPANPNEHYTMLVKKYKVVDPLAAPKLVTP
jgi:hypothetical protein